VCVLRVLCVCARVCACVLCVCCVCYEYCARVVCVMCVMSVVYIVCYVCARVCVVCVRYIHSMHLLVYAHVTSPSISLLVSANRHCYQCSSTSL